MKEITVRKANRIIRVTENELDRYLANGYAIINRTSQSTETKSVDKSVKTATPVIEDTVKVSKKRRSK